ncbi:MAG: oligosaccharide flippase family protein [Steroidobacteraceae bacterium]
MSVGTGMSRSMGGALLGKVVLVGGGMATFALLARYLGAEGLGHYRTVLSILGLSAAVFDFGLYQVTLAEMSRDGVDERRIVGNAFTLRILATATAVILATLGALVARLDHVVVLGLLVGGAGWTAYRVSEWSVAIFQHRLDQQKAAAGEITGVLVTLLAVALLTRTDGGFLAMLAATTFGWLSGMCVALMLARRVVPFTAGLDLPTARGLIRKGLPLGGSKILQVVQLRSDILLLAAVGSLAEVGFYDVGLKLYEIVSTIPFILAGLLMPLFVSDLRAGGAAFAQRLQASVSIVLMVFTLAVVGIMFHADSLSVLLAGPQFVKSGEVMQVLIVAVVFSSIVHPLRFAAIAIGRESVMFRVDIVACAVAVTAYALLIPRYGSLGAAAGKVIADLTTLTITLFVLRREVDAKAWRGLPVAAAGAALLLLLLKAGNALGMHWLLASALSGVVVLGALATLPFVRGELARLGGARAAS